MLHPLISALILMSSVILYCINKTVPKMYQCQIFSYIFSSIIDIKIGYLKCVCVCGGGGGGWGGGGGVGLFNSSFEK